MTATITVTARGRRRVKDKRKRTVVGGRRARGVRDATGSFTRAFAGRRRRTVRLICPVGIACPADNNATASAVVRPSRSFFTLLFGFDPSPGGQWSDFVPNC